MALHNGLWFSQAGVLVFSVLRALGIRVGQLGGPRSPYPKGAAKDKSRIEALGVALYVHGLTACLV